jgi:16S rRNA (uracil1498-N3)-methyltransferase
MALPYFYETEITTGTTAFTLSEETSKHCIKVLRMQVGDQLHITDGKGNLFTAAILDPDKRSTEVSIISTESIPVAFRKVSIAISLLKNTSRFEWFLEKATEIGVSEIIPLICERTERQHFRYERMNNVLVAAMLQSQQSRLPILHEPRPFEEVLISASKKFIAHCEPHQKQELKAISITDDVLMLIGPEGDFSPEEISSALQNNFQPVLLGQTRLRTETAGVVAATLLMNL